MRDYKRVCWPCKEIICHMCSVVVPPGGTKSTIWSFIHLESAFLAFVFGWE